MGLPAIGDPTFAPAAAPAGSLQEVRQCVDLLALSSAAIRASLGAECSAPPGVHTELPVPPHAVAEPPAPPLAPPGPVRGLPEEVEAQTSPRLAPAPWEPPLPIWQPPAGAGGYSWPT